MVVPSQIFQEVKNPKKKTTTTEQKKHGFVVVVFENQGHEQQQQIFRYLFTSSLQSFNQRLFH